MAPKPKLTDAQIVEINARHAADPAITQQQFADEYGVQRALIAKVFATSAAPAAPGFVTALDLALLSPSPLNPRRTFDDAAIAEMAESIAAEGLLQNLIVRAPRENGHIAINGADGSHHNGFYEIIAGERRYRALCLLADAGRWTGPVPCQVREVDDSAHLVLSLLENLQRVDVPPLEEAEAFLRLAKLEPETWTTAAIAARINRSQRYVQQRLALATKLTDGAKQLLREGTIGIEAARALTAADADLQQQILEGASAPHHYSAANIGRIINEYAIHEDLAEFDVAASGLELEEVDGERWFVDRAAFIEKQMEAIEAQRAKLAGEWAFVTVLGQRQEFPHMFAARLQTVYPASTVDKSIHGAAVQIDDDWSVRVQTGLAQLAPRPEPEDMSGNEDAENEAYDADPSRPGANIHGIGPDTDGGPNPDYVPPGGNPAPGNPAPISEPLDPKGPSVTKSHIYHAHRRKSLALQAAVAADWEMATRLACLALLGPQDVLLIRTASAQPRDDDAGTLISVDAEIAKAMGKTKPPQYHGDTKGQISLWARLLHIEGRALQTLFAALVARQIHTPAGYNAELGDSPIADAVADALKIPGHEAAHGLSLIAEDLTGLRKATLLLIADETGTPGINDESKPKDIVEAIVKHRTKLDYVILTLRFGSTKALEKALRDG